MEIGSETNFRFYCNTFTLGTTSWMMPKRSKAGHSMEDVLLLKAKNGVGNKQLERIFLASFSNLLFWQTFLKKDLSTFHVKKMIG